LQAGADRNLKLPVALPAAAAIVFLVAGCAHYQQQPMTVTAYSSDKISTNWKRGKVLFWRKYVASGPN